MCAMARSHLAWPGNGQAPAGRRPARAGAAAAAAVLCAALPLLAGRGVAAQAKAQQAGADQAASPPLTLAVTSVTPSYAEQGRRVRITGLLTNTSGSAASGLSVHLLGSSAALTSRQNLESFVAGSVPPGQVPLSVRSPTRRQLGSGQSWRWTISLPAGALGTSCFGVYPLTVQAGDSVAQAAQVRVPLPYWPAKPVGCPGQARPRPFAISWVWPLIDTPHQDVCAGLVDNRLASSLAPGGRLGYLLAVGGQYAGRAALTWAVDPALLDSVQTMTRPYPTGEPASCRSGDRRPASPFAARWLAALSKATAGRSVFAPPYADVDMAALVHHGNNGDLGRSLTAGSQVVQRMLKRGPADSQHPAGGKNLAPIAWPPGMAASGALLSYLAKIGTKTVILAAPATSPTTYTPGAVTSVLTLVGRRLNILLADRKITALLGSRAATSRSPGKAFGVSQLFLAETAMIAAELPGRQRPIVVAPPQRWRPSRSLASDLLAETVHAPWLTPVTAAQLAGSKPSHVYKQLTSYSASGQISSKLLGEVSELDRQIKLLKSIRVTPDPALDRAVFGIESSAWRGKGSKHAWAWLERTSRYVRSQLRGLSIRSGGGRHATYHVTFGGKTSTVNIVIHNNLRYPVSVGLEVTADKAKVTGEHGAIKVPALSYSAPVKLTVHVQANQGKITLRLVTPDGHPLPAYPLVILVHPTDFGTVALVIIAVALGVFVIASAFRAIRNGRPVPVAGSVSGAGSAPDGAMPDGPVPDGEGDGRGHGSAGPASSGGADPGAGEPGGGDRGGGDRGGMDPGSADSIWAEPSGGGQAAVARAGLADLGNRAEHPDSVGQDRPGLMSAGPGVTGQEPAAPSRRATEDTR